MKNRAFYLLVLILLQFSKVAFTDNDSIVVRELLNANGFYFLPVDSFVTYQNNKIVRIAFYGNKSSRKNVPDFIYTIPSNIGKLSSLKTVIISACRIDSLPKSLFDISGLDSIDVSFNELTYLPETDKLLNLRYLNVSANKLTALPEKIGNMKKLEYLSAGICKLTAVPETFSELTSLRFLDLSSNRFTSIPGELLKLTNIQSLLFGMNLIKEISAEIAQLKNIKSLALDHNLIEIIPPELSEIKSLESINLQNNRICGFDTLAEQFQDRGTNVYFGEQNCIVQNFYKRSAQSWVPVKITGEIKKDSMIAEKITDSYLSFGQNDKIKKQLPEVYNNLVDRVSLKIIIDTLQQLRTSHSDTLWSPVMIQIEIKYHEPLANPYRVCEWYETVFSNLVKKEREQMKNR